MQKFMVGQIQEQIQNNSWRNKKKSKQKGPFKDNNLDK